MSTYYLVDFENLHEDGLDITSGANASDYIYVFFTSNSPKISLDALANQKAMLKILHVPAGKQSLDMSLSSFLGSLVQNRENKYVIVSDDTGYDCVISFWKSLGYNNISRIGSKKVSSPQSPNEKTVLNNRIAAILSEAKVDTSIINYISSLVVKNFEVKSGKQNIYLAIIKKYGQKDGLRYYNLIKKEIKSK